MRSFKKFGVLVTAVFALGAIGAVSASAAQFTYSATGSVTAKATSNQVITTSGGTVTCTTAATSGSIEKISGTELEVGVKKSGCTAFGFATTHFSEEKLLFTAGTGKNVHIKNVITITPTTFGVSACTVTIGPQSVSGVAYFNSGANNLGYSFSLTGIAYASTGGICGPSGLNGTYSGSNEMSRVGGGTLRYDP
jgi:hypothetical protein